MPTYEFRCSNGHTFEQLHKISDAPSTVPCPVCGAVAERVISGGAGLVFKGSGFYLTDYGKNAHRSGSGPAQKPAEKSDAGGSSDSGASSSAAPPSSTPSSSTSSTSSSKSTGDG